MFRMSLNTSTLFNWLLCPGKKENQKTYSKTTIQGHNTRPDNLASFYLESTKTQKQNINRSINASDAPSAHLY